MSKNPLIFADSRGLRMGSRGGRDDCVAPAFGIEWEVWNKELFVSLRRSNMELMRQRNGQSISCNEMPKAVPRSIGHIGKTMADEHFGTDMTDEEYDALDELLTRTTPRLTNIPGVFATQRALLASLDTVAAQYIETRSESTGKTPSQIIGELVREKIAAAFV